MALKSSLLEVDGGVAAARGWLCGTAACGIKWRGRDDVALVLSDRDARAAGVFTTNKVQAAPVLLDRERLPSQRARALVVNAGNANACTGERGMRDARRMAEVAARVLGVAPDQVLVSSTGVIGRMLPMAAIEPGIEAAAAALGPGQGPLAAAAIMTTDLEPKSAAVEVDSEGARVRVGGMAKGSGMIHPDLATMLCFVTTDAALEPGLVEDVLPRVADRSFNQLTVDGDSSTNDTFLLLANGAAGNTPLRAGSPAAGAFEAAVLEVARRLARAIAADGEGATRLLTVRVG
ncbi:MAG: bifunctional ornithine acetyltransferase/N-acetylglutamate synthase, partial [Candidatus Dormibacterales bacterium]